MRKNNLNAANAILTVADFHINLCPILIPVKTL